MRSLALAIVAAAAVNFTGDAQASDWRGAYLGVFGGAAWVDTSVSADLSGRWSSPTGYDQADKAGLLPLLNRDLSATAATGGVTLGYNTQSGSFVTGVETDISAFNDADASSSYSGSFANPYRVETSSKIDWLATARLRAGWSFDRTLVYGTGGIAFGQHSFSQAIVQANVPFQEITASKDTSFGWVLGGGIEHALTDRWSLRAQYLHVDLGAQTVSGYGSCQGVCNPTDTAFTAGYTNTNKADLTLDIVTAGINYRF